MFLNEDFLSLYEELSKINGPLTEGSFDNEEVYGEAAKTIPGLIRYFVAHIETLGAVIERERILASTGESKKASDGMVNGKKLPFVSFSHQLFSHAYRRGSSWKYGVVVDQKKLEQKVQTLHDTSIEDNYVHDNKSSKVFGAAKLSDGSEFIMTSYGQFEINLDDTKRKALGDLQNTGYYEKVKDSFNTRLAAEQQKYADNHAKSITAESFYCTEVPEVIKRYLKTDVEVLEGFLLVDRRQATGVKFTDICSDIPGLFDYLQEHTTLNEGELRVWLPKGEKYLDISGCIVGIVLPSNYKENNLDDETNKAPDVLWVRKLIKEKGLRPFYYKSTNEANIPNVDHGIKRSKTMKRPSIIEYFHKITSSSAAVVAFIKNTMSKYYDGNRTLSRIYLMSIANNTSVTDWQEILSTPYSYRAFLDAIAQYNFNDKDIESICTKGVPLINAVKAFNENSNSLEVVSDFLKQLGELYGTDTTQHGIRAKYNRWMVANTNAKITSANVGVLDPEEVSWNYFAAKCKQKFNLTKEDLGALLRGEALKLSREPITTLFKRAAETNKKSTLNFIQDLASFSNLYKNNYLSHTYINYVSTHATDTNSSYLSRDIEHNYKAWLEKVTDPNGPIKLTKEEVLAYFKEYRAAAQNKLLY
jgi:hypothetical protein